MSSSLNNTHLPRNPGLGQKMIVYLTPNDEEQGVGESAFQSQEFCFIPDLSEEQVTVVNKVYWGESAKMKMQQ